MSMQAFLAIVLELSCLLVADAFPLESSSVGLAFLLLLLCSHWVISSRVKFRFASLNLARLLNWSILMASDLAWSLLVVAEKALHVAGIASGSLQGRCLLLASLLYLCLHLVNAELEKARNS